MFDRVIVIVGAVLIAASLSAAAELFRPTAHEVAAIAAAAEPRVWLHEAEFARDPSLHARPDQVVVLRLHGAARGRLVHHTIPYRFEERVTFNFCIPKDDPHLRSLTLVDEGSDQVIVHVPRGANCKTRTIEPGSYRLHVEHDGAGIGETGKFAFVHVPRLKGAGDTVQHTRRGKPGKRAGAAALTATPAETFPPTCTKYTNPHGKPDIWPKALIAAPPATTQPPPPVNAVLGNLVNLVQALSPTWYIEAGNPDPSVDEQGWAFCRNNPTSTTNPNVYFYFYYGNALFNWMYQTNGSTGVYFNTLQNSGVAVMPLTMTDKGNNQFSFTTQINGKAYNIYVGGQSTGPLVMSTSVASSTLTLLGTYYPPEITPPAPNPGQMAAYAGCNYDPKAGGTFLFNVTSLTTGIPDFSQFRYFPPGSSTIAGFKPYSFKFGSNTYAQWFPGTNYTGTGTYIDTDQICMATPPASLKITTARDFVVGTNGCSNCNLSGIDLSNEDLRGGQFPGSIFTGARLENTDFASANFRNAVVAGTSSPATNLNGTNFIGADFRCSTSSGTNFAYADLTTASMQVSGASPLLQTDFTCRLILSYASLRFDAFDTKQWRYLDLSYAQIADLGGAALSSSSAPLDLSGGRLSGLTFDYGTLDYANMGCATSNNAAACSAVSLSAPCCIATQLDNATFNHASLRRVRMTSALLRSAKLNNANLDSANLCGADLKQPSQFTGVAASLHGAFLRNVNLASADLTGVNLSNANFYSTSSTGICDTSDCGNTNSCASATGALFVDADLSGAYLAGTDFSGTSLQGAVLDGAVLPGANLTNAVLGASGNGRVANFSNSYLLGTKLTNTNASRTNFSNAYINTNNAKGNLVVQLPKANLDFPNYTPSSTATPGCVIFSYGAPALPTSTDSNTTCPNGSFGPCTTTAQWTMPLPAPPACSFDTNWITAPTQ